MQTRDCASDRSVRLLVSLSCLWLLGTIHVPTASADWLAPGEPEPTPGALGGGSGQGRNPPSPTPPAEPDGTQEEVPPSPPPPAPNRTPEIGGTPRTDIHAQELYTFTPTSRDADGDSLYFSIMNKPAWATFDMRTGRLSGTPTINDVGQFTGVRISVSDGEATASLGAFSILVRPARTGSVSLDWQPPTEREDGSALTNLVGYRLFYGRRSGEYTNEIRIDNPGIVRYVVDGLAVGNWHFAMTALDAHGLESELSDEAVRVVRP